ncbi:hypothetical protein NLI96_g8567 [Meripilus lineatus]|uniref:Uncharacterized protein n=1 Tax=Meripilus lineatus TaxID=2056292 RepID=A0AAD5UX23_9APHY|nr:hypothetical protein NLI96_g8567 [Physisporinus lineatus]
MSQQAGIPQWYFADLVGLVLVSYDTGLSFSREVACMWSRRPNLVMILCIRVDHLNDVLSISLMVSDAVFASLRAWAIGGRHWAPLLAVLTLGLFVPAANIQEIQLLILGYVYTLMPKALQLRPIATRVAAMLADFLVLLVTWIKTASLRKIARENHINVSLADMLIRDALDTTSRCLIFGEVNVYLQYCIGNPYRLANDRIANARWNFLHFNRKRVCITSPSLANTRSQHFSLMSILTSRFILDLREVNEAQSGAASTPSSLKFAVQLSATIGAPLNEESVWVTNAGGDVAEENAVSNDPLAEISSRFNEDRLEARE